jgi:hypothetical protein
MVIKRIAVSGTTNFFICSKIACTNFTQISSIFLVKKFFAEESILWIMLNISIE